MKTSRIPAAVILAAGLVLALPAPAALNAYLKIDGVEGESTDAQHMGWIEVDSFQLDQIRRAGEIGSATGGAGAGKVTFHDISITKKVDKASPKLFQACASGKHYSTATIAVRKTGGSQQFLVVKLENVLISSFKAGGSGKASPQDSFTLNFANGEFENLPPNPRPNPAAAVAAPVGSIKR